jgi:leucyl-tRNA synthetase
LEVPADITDEAAKEAALSSEKIKTWLEGKEIRKIIFVKGKLINLVI